MASLKLALAAIVLSAVLISSIPAAEAPTANLNGGHEKCFGADAKVSDVDAPSHATYSAGPPPYSNGAFHQHLANMAASACHHLRPGGQGYGSQESYAYGAGAPAEAPYKKSTTT